MHIAADVYYKISQIFFHQSNLLIMRLLSSGLTSLTHSIYLNTMHTKSKLEKSLAIWGPTKANIPLNQPDRVDRPTWWWWWCDPSENESFARETMTCKVAWSKDCKKMRKQYKKGHDLRMPKLWVFKLHSLHTHTLLRWKIQVKILILCTFF